MAPAPLADALSRLLAVVTDAPSCAAYVPHQLPVSMAETAVWLAFASLSHVLSLLLAVSWPWGLALLVLVAAGAFWWDDLLAWEPGKYWPAVAAFLPPCIPIARSFQENARPSVRYATVAVLLLAVAVVQLYGQERNNRDRIKTEARFSDLFDEVIQGRTAIEQQGIEVRRIADGITALAAQAEEEIEDD
jgi:hypothetical protein